MSTLSNRLTRLEESRPARPVRIFFIRNHDERTELEALYPDNKLILFVRGDE